VIQTRNQSSIPPGFAKRVINLGKPGGKEYLNGKGLSDDLIGKIGTGYERKNKKLTQ
jgi:hypothetical protein